MTFYLDSGMKVRGARSEERGTAKFPNRPPCVHRYAASYGFLRWSAQPSLSRQSLLSLYGRVEFYLSFTRLRGMEVTQAEKGIGSNGALMR